MAFEVDIDGSVSGALAALMLVAIHYVTLHQLCFAESHVRMIVLGD